LLKKYSSSTGMLGDSPPHQMSFSVFTSFTTCLSLGERPVLAPLSTMSAPSLLKCELSSSLTARSHSSAGERLCITQVGLSRLSERGTSSAAVSTWLVLLVYVPVLM